MTRSTAGLIGVFIVSALAAGVPLSTAQAPGDSRLTRLYEANDLDVDGHSPYHLQMSFQLYDLKGKVSEQGTVQITGAPGRKRHIVIHAPLLKDDGKSVVEDSPDGEREAYLVSELIDVVLNPVSKPSPNPTGAQMVSRQFGKVVLACVSSNPTPSSAASNEALICTESAKDAARFLSRPGGLETISRNSVGLFHETNVALDVQIAFGGIPAVSAKVTTLQAVDPATLEPPQATDPVKPPSPTSDLGAERQSIAGGVIAGFRKSYIQPEYPSIAKAGRMSGSVVLHAIIAKDGSVQHLVAIASPDPMFTDSAIAAVSKWTYKPYMLNGNPTDVDTIITVNFALAPAPDRR